MSSTSGPVRGRGAVANPKGRFERLEVEPVEPEFPAAADGEPPAAGPPRLPTRLIPDASRSVLATNDSPDIPFDTSFNPYRGCEHGCAYCYARPTHEYLGFSAGLDFESRILVKEDAPAMLRRELGSPRWKPQVVAISGVTDPYQPIERELGVTRRSLEVFAECRNPVAIVTKNHLVTRDADLLAELAAHRAAAVYLSVTTLDPALARVMEPRASHPRRRLEAVAELRSRGIPAGVMIAPVVPAITDHEIPALVAAAAEAGAVGVRYILLRLPGAVAPLFERWLEERFPERKEKVLSRVRSLRGGRLNDPRFGSRFRGEGAFAEQVRTIFEVARRRHGLTGEPPPLSTDAFRPPRRAADGQLQLF